MENRNAYLLPFQNIVSTVINNSVVVCVAKERTSVYDTIVAVIVKLNDRYPQVIIV